MSGILLGENRKRKAVQGREKQFLRHGHCVTACGVPKWLHGERPRLVQEKLKGSRAWPLVSGTRFREGGGERGGEAREMPTLSHPSPLPMRPAVPEAPRCATPEGHLSIPSGEGAHSHPHLKDQCGGSNGKGGRRSQCWQNLGSWTSQSPTHHSTWMRSPSCLCPLCPETVREQKGCMIWSCPQKGFSDGVGRGSLPI